MNYVTAVFPPYTANRTYTYETEFDAQPDEYYVVKTPGNGYQVIQIRKVDQPKPNFPCKPLIQKVVDDTSSAKSRL